MKPSLQSILILLVTWDMKFLCRSYKMPCPICTGALISKAAQGIAALGAVKHVKDRKKPKPKKKSPQKQVR